MRGDGRHQEGIDEETLGSSKLEFRGGLPDLLYQLNS
jgi:hypothetical protein